MEDDSEIAVPESQMAVSKNKEDGSDPESRKKKVMTIGSTSIIPLKGAAGAAPGEVSSSILCGGRDSDSDRDEAEASDDDMIDEVDDNGRGVGRKGGSKRGSGTVSPDPPPPSSPKKEGELSSSRVVPFAT